MIQKKAWDAISDEQYAEIWGQIRVAIHTVGRKASAEPLEQLTREQKAAFFNRLCCDYGKCVWAGGYSTRKEKVLQELKSTLDLLHDMFDKPLRR
jgi:hypothetical protein